MNKDNNLFFYSNIRKFDMSIGITKKVLNQVNTFVEMGFNVFYSAYTVDGIGIFDSQNHLIFSRKNPFKSRLISRIYRRRLLIKTVIEYHKLSNSTFDILYARFHFFDKAYLRMINEFKRQKTYVIIEAHAYPYKYRNFTLMHWVYLKDTFYSRYAKKYVDLVAAMSSYKNIWGINTVQIENGINLNDYPMITRKNHDTINIICVANETKFHQYSKVINGLYKYNNSKEIKFKIIFIGEYMKSTVSLVKKLKLSEHVTFKGKLYGADLLEQYSVADLALGAFSYKKLGEKSSLLKTKEYIALGIPVITGWDELSFYNQLPFVHLQNTNKKFIDFCFIYDFYIGLSNIKNLKDLMRSFAEKNYTWQAQLDKVIDQYRLEVQK